MSAAVWAKAVALWFGILALAMLNGAAREKLLVPSLGSFGALVLSGLLLSACVFLVALVAAHTEGAPPPGVARLDGVVELVQPTGSRTYATLRLGALPVVAELQAHDVNRPGERIGLQLDMNSAALFAAETKKAL